MDSILTWHCSVVFKADTADGTSLCAELPDDLVDDLVEDSLRFFDGV